MPDGKTHRSIGAGAGAVAAGFYAREQNLIDMIIEAFGGWLAGRFGGALPDLLEPAVTPNHRKVAHAVMPNAAIAEILIKNVPLWQEILRKHAAQAALRRKQAPSDTERAFNLISELFFLLAAGAVVGLPAGYASHLVLDARTPKGLPLIG